MNDRIYLKYCRGETVLMAKIELFQNRRYGFMTKLHGEGEWEKNINMPMFETAREAIQWIENNPAWR